ncbi:aldehyde dehydrogenase (NADP(+)) [Leucobacter komagatae]|uniref:Aldehyde dehydrogenase n=1 Tax=Leucobacter komagatae TaxID=55969 RepID=A0A0D0H317_9MICO|nr:aldehyde dehydrogenase (NADP(+)) [Leucobacter komagatae]KIP51500.1 aldehyde dehydrogenase [Leucobacter komagatae]
MSPHTLNTADDPSTIDPILAAAAAAAVPLALLAPEVRAGGLCLIADRLEADVDQLVTIAESETGLTPTRLRGELKRTAVQLRLFAESVIDGSYVDARIDEADDQFVLGTRPDLRRSLRPVGPVLNFAASNFPFAFSVAGGDSAAALAAGCPLIVKVHSGHPKLSVATGEIMAQALFDAGFPSGAFALIFGQQTGVDSLKDSRIQAGSFTGSISAGRLLADIAAARPQPIQFFGELGSVNPAVVTPAALNERRDTIATGFVSSVSGSAGQLCTKPGFLFAPTNHGLDSGISEAARSIPPHRLLNPRIADSYAKGVASALSLPGVRPIVEGMCAPVADGNMSVTPTIAAVSLTDFISSPQSLHEEVFGPFSLIVEYDSLDDVAAAIAKAFQGNLTGTLHLSMSEQAGTASEAALASVRTLTDLFALMVGRLVFNDWPTGVSVTPAQQHGGPWPATTNDSSTSVGTAAIQRFLRPVAFQGAPEHLLPPELQLKNPRGLKQTINSAGASARWGLLDS